MNHALLKTINIPRICCNGIFDESTFKIKRATYQLFLAEKKSITRMSKEYSCYFVHSETRDENLYRDNPSPELLFCSFKDKRRKLI